jgi:uncharacterized membrane protein YphA (DoxX/SURF4 family)
MIRRFLSPYGLWQDGALALARILVGLFMIYHGWEIFNAAKMNDYAKWMTELGFPGPSTTAYVGKGAELVSGILLLLGLFTRLGALVLAFTMAAICFGMGKGRIFMEDQHPFLFVVIAFIFFFTGPGKWSFDRVLFGNNRGIAPPKEAAKS